MNQELFQHIHRLNEMVLQGKALEAFEQFYADDVIMQENESIPTIGKENNRKREETFFNAITEFRLAKPLHVSVGEQVTMVQWHYDYTHAQWGVRNYHQVSVQHWKEGKIVKEQFFYGN